MQIAINNPVGQTIIFGIILLAAILIFIKKKQPRATPFPISTTNELKGLAILAVIFGHIGYFLAQDTRFLFPFSTISGVGVDIFLLLSGFGLTASALSKQSPLLQTYTKRLIHLFIPLWLAVTTFFILDKFLLHQTYSIQTIWQSLIGFFPTADIFTNLDSPLWYFTLILFYYLLFPLLLWKKQPIISALILFIITRIFLRLNLPINADVIKLYKLHTVAFPLGIIFAALLYNKNSLLKLLPEWLAKLLDRPNKFAASIIKIKNLKNITKFFIIILLIIIVIYTSIHSGVDKSIEIKQAISIITTIAIVLIFILKNTEFGILSLLGIYSYEIYLIHWPILYRYDIFYKFLPPFLATTAYLILFILLGYIFKKIVNLLTNNIIRKM